MINPSKFTFLDKEAFEIEVSEGIGNFPKNRNYKKYIQRGFLILDKPVGPTSHDVVSMVKKILNISKAGHLGTLDPNVSGVLPIGLEDSTKVLSILANSRKRYICNLKLHGSVEKEKIEEVINYFTGQIYQFPPLKSNVAMRLRKRTIYSIDLLEKNHNEYLLDILCEAGTYIRVLCIDIGKILGVGGEMKELRRINSANYTEKDLISLHEVFDAYQDAKEGFSIQRLKEIIQPVELMVKHLPGIVIRSNAIETITNGATLALPGILAFQNFKNGEKVRILTPKGELVALGNSLTSSEGLIELQKGNIIHPYKVIFQKNEIDK